MVVELSETDVLDFDALSTSSAESFPHNDSFAFLLSKDLGRAAVDENIRIFFMVEIVFDLDAGHQSIETS